MHCMPQMNKELGWVMKSAIYVKTPVGWGSTYCFTAVGVVGFSVTASHQLLRDLLFIFFWMACFLFPRSLSFDFCYDLDIWAQGQALIVFFVIMSFFTILSRGGF